MSKNWYQNFLKSLVQESQDYERGGTQKDEYSPEEVVTVPCPLCRSEERRIIYTEHGVVGITRCLSCSLIYTSPRVRSPEKDFWGNIDKYYAEARLIFEGKAHHCREPNFIEELELIGSHKPRGRLLDIGCNMGMFLYLARKRGWEVVGMEPSPSLSQLATERFGLKVYNCFIDGVPRSEYGFFDVITISDVLEHDCDPLPFLKKVNQLLADDGIIYIKVPNAKWNLFKQKVLGFMGRRPKQGIWASCDHVVHYTHATLDRILEKSGFHIIKVTIAKPMQPPVWHEYVGHYYQYPSPWFLDWKRHIGRLAFYWLSWLEYLLRLGSIGDLAPNIVVLSEKK